MLEALFSIFGELLIQLLGELLLEFGFHALAEPFRREPNPWLAALAYAAFGAAAGGLSLWLLPTHLTPAGLMRTLNLMFTPIVAGLAMAALGAWRVRRGQPLLRIDRFLYGYVFALGLALVRFFFAA
jgi:hypothetical protein